MTKINISSLCCPIAGVQCAVPAAFPLSHPTLHAPVSAQPISSPLRRHAGSPEAQLRMRGVLLPPVRSAIMAASVASPGRALWWVGATWLRRGGMRELLRPQIEGSTPGRDFSLSHCQVRAGWGLGSYTVGDRCAIRARPRPRGGLSLGCGWPAGWLGALCGPCLTPASLTTRARSSWSAGGRCRSPGRAVSRACTGVTACISLWRT